MLATTIIDPLLSSPTQVQRHDDDMAVTFPSSSSSLALQTPQLMDSLTYSTSYSSEQNDDDQQYQQQQQQFMDSLTYSTSKSTEQNEQQQQEEQEEQQQEEAEEEEDETPFEQLMNRGNYLRQLRALALQDEMERHASTLLEQEEKKNDYHDDSIDSGRDLVRDDDDDEFGPSKNGRFVIVSPNISRAVSVIPSSSNCVSYDDEELCDHIYTISTTTTTTTSNNSNEKVKVLEYNSYLAHQRYYDDLKHVDITYMDYGIFPPHPSSSTTATTTTEFVEGGNEYDGDGGGRVVIEQRKRLGKGGFCWDAAFMLGEHVIAHEEDWNNNVNRRRSGGGGATVLELGAGTGLCGIMIGKATKSQVTITDLPELEELMGDNVRRNFGPSVDEDGLLSEEERKLMPYLDGKRAKGTVTSRVLRWGVEEDYFLNNDNEEQQAYDVIIGADIVASLYDPVALAQTLHALCGPTTKIYISSKSRLDKPHETFDAEMARLFEKVEKKVGACSRLKNPNVFIIQAEGKR